MVLAVVVVGLAWAGLLLLAVPFRAAVAEKAGRLDLTLRQAGQLEVGAAVGQPVGVVVSVVVLTVVLVVVLDGGPLRSGLGDVVPPAFAAHVLVVLALE